MRKLLSTIAVFLFVSCFTHPANAADNKKNAGTLILVHRTGLVQNETYRADWERINLESEMGLELRSTEEITVVVKDPNPLLFTYSWNGIKETDTVDYQNATKFAGALNSLLSVLSQAAAQPPTGRALSAQRRAEDIAAERFGPNKKWSDLTPAQQREATIRAEIKAILDDLSKNNFFELFKGNVKTITNNTALLPVLIQRSGGDESAVIRLKSEVEQWNLDSLADQVERAFVRMDDAQLKILEITSTNRIEDLESIDPRILAILTAKDQQLRIERMIDTLQSFRKDVDAIDRPLTLGTFAYSPTKVRTASFEIKPVAANARVADSTRRRTGTFSFIAEPLSPVHFGFGGAMVYSFVEIPKFAVEKVNDKLTIIQKNQNDEYVGQKVAAVLAITPRAWSDPIFGGQFEIGFNPEKDKLAFFLGASLRLYNFVHVGAGWTYQEVPALASGLRVGQEVPSADALKLDTEFKSGVYISISVTTK